MTCKLKDRCKQGETCVAHNGYDIWRCTAFKDKGVPMTNEEWLKQANTEQLAEWFANSGFLPCGLRECDDCKYYDKKNDDCDFNFYGSINHKQMWVEWLKQPHTNE